MRGCTDEHYDVIHATTVRARLLCDRTLALLRKHNVPPERIHIFVANEAEKQDIFQSSPLNPTTSTWPCWAWRP